MISRFFIDRPVLANVLAMVFVLIGLVALLQLPTAEYPNVVPPTVQVSTRYPGATAKTLVDTVALPIEQQVDGVEDMLYMYPNLRNRHRPRQSAYPGPEPSILRHYIVAPGRANPGCYDGEEIEFDSR